MIGKNPGLFKCFCNTSLDITLQDNFKKHIVMCREFQNKSPLSRFFNSTLKIDSLSVDELQILKSEMEIRLEEITGFLEMRKGNLSENQFRIEFGFTQFDSGMMNCDICAKLYDFPDMIFLESCEHSFCKNCLIKQISESIVKMIDCLCRKCQKRIGEYEKKSIVGNEKYNELIERAAIGDMKTVTCVKCRQTFLFEPGAIQRNMKDEHGNTISKEHENHYAENRFKCGVCGTEQCQGCNSTPYHLGKTCAENKKLKESKLCKYCEEIIEVPSPANSDICNKTDCLEKYKEACQNMLICGHSCCGFKDERNCLACLHENCEKTSSKSLNGQTGQDYCMICGVERLINAPCVQSKCGHIFHVACITTRLNKRWHRPRITFNFCLCPLCKAWLEFPIESPLQTKLSQYLKILDDLKRKSLERLKYESRDKDERLTTVGDAYYNKPVEYALAIYSYYECFKCKKPYFGGLKRCEDLMAEEAKNDSFKPEELVCAECADVGVTLENCPKHGREYIEFKCRYCCSVATWFCWGSTHFCEPCHKRQVAGDYISKYPREKLPKCGGKGTCPLKVDHKPNGEETALGCSLCRNLMNSHGF